MKGNPATYLVIPQSVEGHGFGSHSPYLTVLFARRIHDEREKALDWP